MKHFYTNCINNTLQNCPFALLYFPYLDTLWLLAASLVYKAVSQCVSIKPTVNFLPRITTPSVMICYLRQLNSAFRKRYNAFMRLWSTRSPIDCFSYWSILLIHFFHYVLIIRFSYYYTADRRITLIYVLGFNEGTMEETPRLDLHHF